MTFDCLILILNICLCLRFYGVVEGSCEFPFHPLQHPNDPDEFWYCESPKDVETCPGQSNCEDLWLGLYVCCGYNVTVPGNGTRYTVYNASSAEHANRTATPEFVRRSRKLLRLFFQDERNSVNNQQLSEGLVFNNRTEHKDSLYENRTSTRTTKSRTESYTVPSTTVAYRTINAMVSKIRTTRNVTLYLDRFNEVTNRTLEHKVTKESEIKLRTITVIANVTTTRFLESRNQTTTVATTIAKTPLGQSTTASIKLEKGDVVTNKRRSVNPEIFILQEGQSRKVNATSYRFPATITLIIDHGKSVIVDTGLPTDFELLGLFLTELNRYGVDADSIDVVVTTHGHPDHFGHLNLFPSAIQIFGGLIYIGNTFSVSDLYVNEVAKLTDNISVYKTPGHTAEDLTVLVKNVTDLGTVAVVGDLFFSREDIIHPELWESQAWNVSMQEEYRHLILCRVDYIVPGHGSMYKVEEYMRRRFGC